MKKFLIVAALVAASAIPSVPVNAADMGTMADKPASPALCFFLPLLPKCIEYWKEKGEDAKAKWMHK
jgi:hypothetical protein